MNDQAALAAHTFELYGLDAPPLALSAFGLDPHAACDLTTFCRNPLHPGPCKGWKNTLKAVAPGVHKMLEDDRLAKVAARRKAREGGGGKGKGGKGRDGDGDGKKGEGEYEKKGRRKPKAEPEPEKDVPYAEPGHEVKLSKETRALVASATKALPKDDEGWKDVVQGPATFQSASDAMVQNALTKYAQAIVERDESRDNFARNLRGMSWEDLTAKHPSEADTLTNSPTGRRLEQNIKQAGENHTQIKDFQDNLKALVKAEGGDLDNPNNGNWPSRFEHLREHFTPKPQRGVANYPRDANGVALPPPELVKMHDAVQKAGRAIRSDLAAAFAEDPKTKSINDEISKFSDQAFNDPSLSKRHEARLEIKRLQYERKKRERELVVDALDQFRPMGGGKIGDVTPVTMRSELDRMNRSDAKVARRDWRAQLDETAAHLPTDWVERSNKVKMNVISNDRAYHSSPNDWRDGTNQAATTLAMNSDKGAAGVAYNGAFPNYVHEVTMHEFGHRLESQIPGIKALEFAYVRSKTTLPNGNVEPQVKLKDVYGGSYTDSEVAFRDNFPNLYTGKTYEARNNDPANESWEAFQVGLQDTFGRSSTKYGEPDLEDLVLGAMATLGRS